MTFPYIKFGAKVLTVLLACLLFIAASMAQSNKYTLRTIAFYNVENLFDTIDDPDTIDEDYTPNGKNHYTAQAYTKKIKRTAMVIAEIGYTQRHQAPVIIGLAEIENYTVLHDLVRTESLGKYQYQIIHADSPDRRGIDVAILYQERYFKPIETEVIELRLWNDKGERIYTRDILYAHGYLDQEEIHLVVNHWPSRRGGKTRSDPKRMKAAFLVKNLITTILGKDPKARILIMGDFNDDPMDNSIKQGLLLPSDFEKQLEWSLFNPMEKMHKKGMNTLAYRDGLNLFDQILISSPLYKKEADQDGYHFYRAGIYNPNYLIVQHGRYKGYPYRSFENNRYSDGFSDHYPVFVELIKPYH